jgi:phosphomevalonate kinase
MIAATAPGKMILIGEYAVLYGASSLVCAMDCRASVKLSSNMTNKFEISAPSLSIVELSFLINDESLIQFDDTLSSEKMKMLHFFKIVFEETFQFIKAKKKSFPPVKIEINTDDFYSPDRKQKYGFGSSAAMTVALIEAMLIKIRMLGKMSMEELFKLAYRVHRKAQGNLGSGIDIAASIYGNVLLYQLQKEEGLPPANCLPLVRWQSLYVLPIWAGRSTSTRKMVRNVDKLEEESPAIFNRIMDELILCSEKGCTAYIERNRKIFFDSITEYNHVLTELGEASGSPIVSEEHKKLINLINTQSNSVYKPSGAGGGDIGIAFCDSLESVDGLKRLLKNTEFRILDFQIANEGVSVTSIGN